MGGVFLLGNQPQIFGHHPCVAHFNSIAMIKVFKLIIQSIAITFIVVLLLVLTRQYFLNIVLQFIKEIRGTEHYIGESKASEQLFIIAYIITPIVFITSLLLLFLRNRIKRSG